MHQRRGGCAAERCEGKQGQQVDVSCEDGFGRGIDGCLAAARQEEGRRRLAAAGAGSDDALRREAGERLRALEAAAGAAPRTAMTGSVGDFLPAAMRGAMRRHDLIRRMEARHRPTVPARPPPEG